METSIIRQIVNRCHVADTDAKVLEYLKSRLIWSEVTPKDWQRLRSKALRIHHANQKLFAHYRF